MAYRAGISMHALQPDALSHDRCHLQVHRLSAAFSALCLRRSRSWSWGAKVERRRREPSRGAEAAVPPLQKFFKIFWGHNGVFSCTIDAYFFNNQNNTKIHQECMDCHRDWLACDKERFSGATTCPTTMPHTHHVLNWSKFPLP